MVPVHDSNTSPSTIEGPQALLSILSSASNGAAPHSQPITNPSTPSIDTALPRPSGSRFFPKPLPSDISSPVTSDPGSSTSQAPPQFNPPPGSRLLAFGARNASGPSSASNTGLASSQPLHGLHPSLQQHHGLQMSSDIYQNNGMPLSQSSDINHRSAMSEAMRAQQGFSPFELQSRSTFAFEDSREPANYGHSADALRRTSVVSPADRTPFSMTSESGSTYSSMGGGHVSANSDSFSVNGSGIPFDPISNASQNGSGKGSRFLKYFEEKGRENQAGGVRKPQGPIGFQSSSPNPGLRHDQNGFNGLPGGQPDSRTVDDLFAMLNTSAQVSHWLLSN